MKKLVALILSLLLAAACLPLNAFAEDVPTLKVLAVLDPRTPELETLANYQKIEKDAGVKIEWEYILGTAWAEQKSLILSSGDLPDIFLGAKSMTTSDISSNSEYFLPLQDLIQEYGNYIQDMWAEYPATKIANTYPDGNIYSIGHVMSKRPATEAAMYINKTWLDRLNLDVPTTVDELTEVLRAFRDQDANGNGDPGDEIPIIGRSLTSKYGPACMRGYFQADNCIEYELVVDENGKVRYMPVTENYKAWVEWVRLLMEEKLINDDVVTIDSTRYRALQANEGACICGVVSGWTQFYTAQWLDEYVALDIEEGPFGKAYVPANEELLLCGISGWATVSVTTACKNPEAAIRWINLFYEPFNGLQAYWGPVDVTFALQEDGMYDFLEVNEEELGHAICDNWYYGLGDGGIGYVSKEIDQTMKIGKIDMDKIAADTTYADNVRDASYIYPPIILERMTNDQAQEIKTDMDKLTREMTAKWIMEGGIEDEWETYLSEMTKMGLDRYLEIYQAELDKIRN